ncbi:MAG: TetR/AcrR family transcriptional regulator [Lachnospiraceae bacterium]|nr:TetR/AcrR family transcriptional regulator [Lachnospiraceae bacterium]
MKTNKEEIMLVALKMFAERGFEAVSTSMIAGELGITKGALYRHFKNKQEIFDSIIRKMFEQDEKQANDNSVPAGEYADDAESYKNTSLKDVCEFTVNQYKYWTEDEFASSFRKMITLEQFKNEEMSKLYQDVLASGPVNYTEDLFREMIKNGQLNSDAKTVGARSLATLLYAPLLLSIQMSDAKGADKTIEENLRTITEEFRRRWGS